MNSPLPINHVWVDSTLAPIYEVTFPPTATVEELREYFRAIETWSEQVEHKVIWVMNGSNVREFSAVQRSDFGAFLRRMHDFDQRCTHAAAIVVDNPILRGAMTAVFWIHRPPYKQNVFASIEAARGWAADRASELAA